MPTRADRAYEAAIRRWCADCEGLPPGYIAAAERAWQQACGAKIPKQLYPLIAIIANMMRARDEAPGDDRWWQHEDILAARAVLAACKLCRPAKTRRKAKRRAR